MAGFTQRPFREICLAAGAGLAYTELVVAEGVARRMPATMAYLASSPIDHPTAAHLYGRCPEAFVRAAAVIEAAGTFPLIDINAGCPVRKVVKKGAGCALLHEPERIFEIVRALKRHTALPVTLKTRIGLVPGDGRGLAAARAAAEAGIDALCIHARYAEDRHNGPPHLDELVRIREQVDVPLIANGGADTAGDALRILHETGAEAVMIGRAALGNPWLFGELEAARSGRPWHPPGSQARHQHLIDHAQRITHLLETDRIPRRRQRLTVEQEAFRLFRAHLQKYLAGSPGSRKTMQTIQERLEGDTSTTLVSVLSTVLSG